MVVFITLLDFHYRLFMNKSVISYIPAYKVFIEIGLNIPDICVSVNVLGE